MPTTADGSNASWGQNAQGQWDYNGQQNNPSLATNWYGSQAAAKAAWQAANPSAAKPTPQPAATPVPASQQPQISQNLTPTYLSQLLGGKNPQSTAYTVGNVPLVQAGQTGPAGNVNAAQATAYGANAGQATSSDVNTEDMVRKIMSGLSPQFNQQNQALSESLANAGIVGGSTAGAVTQQGLQQQAQAQSQIQPLILSAMQGNQSADNSTSQFNAGQNTNVSEYNAGADSANSQYNASNRQSADTTNVANALNVGEYNAGNRQQASGQNATNALNAGEYNAGTQNANSQFNVANAIKNAMFDASQGTQAGATLAGYQNQDWLAQLNAQANLSSARAGATSSAAQPVYQQPAQSNFSGLASAFAPMATAAQPAAVQLAAPTYTPLTQSQLGGQYRPQTF